MVTNLLEKIKSYLAENRRDLFLAILVFLMSVASFGLGRLSAIWPVGETITIENPHQNQEEKTDGPTSAQIPDPRSQILDSARGSFVASSKGSSYHLPTCPGAKQIKDENRVWFETKEEAEAAGYTPAANCPGL